MLILSPCLRGSTFSWSNPISGQNLVKPAFASKEQLYIFNPIDIDFEHLGQMSLGPIDLTKEGLELGPSVLENLKCQCHGQGGVPIVFWEPAMLAEVVARAGHCPLFALNLVGTGPLKGGILSSQQSFYHVHLYDFFPFKALLEGISKLPIRVPLLEMMLEPLQSCLSQSESIFSIRYFSELDMTHSLPSLSYTLTPEIFSLGYNRHRCESLHTCRTDAFHAHQTGRSLDSLYFCSGTHQYTFPLTGHILYPQRSLDAAMTVMQKAIFKMHRRSIVSQEALGSCLDTSLCQLQQNFTPLKSQYSFQMLYPHPLKKLTLLWGQAAPSEVKLRGSTGNVLKQSQESFVFLIYRKRRCCAKVSKKWQPWAYEIEGPSHKEDSNLLDDRSQPNSPQTGGYLPP